MKTRNLTTAAAVPAIALGLAFALPVAAQDNASTTGTTDTRMQADDTGMNSETMSMQSDHKRPKKLGDYLGKEVNADDGTELGSISNLVIDANSGKISHAIVRAGGVLGIGGEEKAVSFDALKPAMGEEGGVTLASEEWNSAQPFQQDQLATLGSTETQNAQSRKVLASELDDLDLHNQNGAKIGEVEDLIIEADQHKASLLVEVEDDIAGDDRAFVIGFNRVTLSGAEGEERTLTTELQQSDFRTAAANVTAMEQDYVWLEGGEATSVAE